MASAKEVVEKELRKRKWSKSKLMKLLGYQTGYQDFYSLFVKNPHQLTDEKREQIARVLDQPVDWLKDGGEQSARKREHHIREEFEKYLQTEVGRDADPETHRILESMTWTGKWLPSVRLYQAVTMAMEGRYTEAQLLDALQLEADDNALLEKRPSQPRKRARKSR